MSPKAYEFPPVVVCLVSDGSGRFLTSLRELANPLAHLGERLLQIGKPRLLGLCQLLRQPPLAQLQQQLLSGLLVDPLRLGARVELSDERLQLGIRLFGPEDDADQPTVHRRVEMLRAELREDAVQLR